jgi:hypothetical protein
MGLRVRGHICSFPYRDYWRGSEQIELDYTVIRTGQEYYFCHDCGEVFPLND